MNPKLIISAVIFLLSALLLNETQTYAADYGYKLGNDDRCSVWWAEGAYKVMQNDPVPSGKAIPVQLKSAKNENESFQIILNPHSDIRNLTIKMEDLKDKAGNIVPAGNITIREVVYVHVLRPTDDYGKAGWYPDPLPVLEAPINLSADKNYPFWITVKIPSSAKSGNYSGTIQLLADGWSRSFPISIEVWNFSLPEKPTMKSSFGLNTDYIRQYHNLKTEEELKTLTDTYYRAMHDYKIAPTAPFRLYPMKVRVDGLNWSGGIFASDMVYSGKKALKVIDNDPELNVEASTIDLIEIDPAETYMLTWYAQTSLPDQKYCVLLQCYDKDREKMIFENRMEVFTGDQTWEQDTLKPRSFRKEIKFVSVHLFPVFPDPSGRNTGTGWFDDIRLTTGKNSDNLIPQGDFEVFPKDLFVKVDFTEFDIAGEKYLDGLGFNAYHLPLQGLPSGNFHAQRRGVFNGFAQGTPEYDQMMKKYLIIVQDHLEEKGWLGKEYVYWFDEPNTENYPFVREGMEIIHRSAPKITRFITEHQPGPDIMDVTEISCTVIGRLNQEIIKELVAGGTEFWSYVCCCPKAPYLSLFIDHDAINMRMWLWLSYQYQLTGILVWSANFWNSLAASPIDYLQNPWEDPMSYTTSFGWPLGKQTGWGNGDGRFFYPPNRHPGNDSRKYFEGPVPSIRLEILRDGIEDYEYLLLLKKAVEQDNGKHKKLLKEARKLLNLPPEMLKSPKEYNKDPQYLIRYRNKIGQILSQLNNYQI